MADEFDKKLMPEIVQTTFAISLGAAYKSIEMMKHPQDTLSTMMTEIQTLFSIPPDANEGLQNKAQAVAAVWMEKGAVLMEQCKSTGQKFAEGE